MNDFKTKYGPWALVAGASEGLGAAFAEALAKRGLNLVLIARRLEKLKDIADQLISKYQVDVQYQSLDLADFNRVKGYIVNLDVPVGLLVYNAAYAPIGYFEDIFEKDLAKVVDVNIKAPLLLSKLVSRRMIENRKGGIVLMSSLAGMQGSPKIAAYAASKAFNAVLTEGIWSELKKHDVDVIASVAGAVSTPGYEEAKNSGNAPGTLEAKKVAEKTLNALGKGPITVPGLANKISFFVMRRLLPKKLAISIMNKNTKDLS